MCFYTLNEILHVLSANDDNVKYRSPSVTLKVMPCSNFKHAANARTGRDTLTDEKLSTKEQIQGALQWHESHNSLLDRRYAEASPLSAPSQENKKKEKKVSLNITVFLPRLGRKQRFQ